MGREKEFRALPKGTRFSRCGPIFKRLSWQWSGACSTAQVPGSTAFKGEEGWLPINGCVAVQPAVMQLLRTVFHSHSHRFQELCSIIPTTGHTTALVGTTQPSDERDLLAALFILQFLSFAICSWVDSQCIRILLNKAHHRSIHSVKILHLCHLIGNSTHACLRDSPDLPHSTPLTVSKAFWFTHGMWVREAEKKSFVKEVESALTPQDLHVPG